MSAQIYSQKQQQDNTAYENSAYIDAENTLWIETKEVINVIISMKQDIFNFNRSSTTPLGLPA